MASQAEQNTYACTLLFQFRKDNSKQKKRLCEERIFKFNADSDEEAFTEGVRIGKSEEMVFEYETFKEFYEFVGILELVELTVFENENEIWHRFCEKECPMERKNALLPLKNNLNIFQRRLRFPGKNQL